MSSWFTVLSGGAGAPPFNPQTQGTLVNWYDSSVLGLSNGASVTTFTDSKTGNPNPLTTTSTPGTYATNAQNFLSVVTFNGSNQNYTTGGSSASNFPYTLAAIIKVTNVTASRTILGPHTTGGLQFRLDITTGNISLIKSGSAPFATSSSAVSTGAWHLVVATVTSSTYAFEIDGVAAGSGSHAETLTAARNWRLGVSVNSELFIGSIGEVQIYSSVLSSADLSGLHTYSVNKWATP